MAWKSSSWTKFPKGFGFSGSKGMKEVRFMARGGKVQKVATAGLKNTDAPKAAIPTGVKVADFEQAGKVLPGSPSHGRGAKTPGGTRMPKAKGGAVKGGGALCAPRPRSGALPVGSMNPRIK